MAKQREDDDQVWSVHGHDDKKAYELQKNKAPFSSLSPFFLMTMPLLVAKFNCCFMYFELMSAFFVSLTKEKTQIFQVIPCSELFVK